MGVFKVLSETQSSEKAVKGSLAPASLPDAENQISFHYFGVLGIIIGHPVFGCHARET